MAIREDDFLTLEQRQAIVRDVIDLFLIPRFLALGMEATGEWREALEAKDSSIYGRKYTAQLVNGRSPGTFAPIEPLKRWAMAKFGYDEREALSMAFAVSKTLKEKGSKYYQQGGTDLLEILNSTKVLNFISQTSERMITENVRIYLTRELKSAFR